jgi:hypothetical protein
MRLPKLVALGVLAVSLAACGATATNAPGVGADATAPTPVPTSGGASAPAGGGGNAGDVTGLPGTATAKMCGLLSSDEAKGIIGKDIAVPPNGVLFKGLGTNCIWQTDDTMAPGTFIKVEINPVTYKTNAGLITLLGSASSQITVAGLDATAVDVGGLQKDASLVIRLSGDNPVSMLIQAPTLAMARAVAEKVIPRLVTLK